VIWKRKSGGVSEKKKSQGSVLFQQNPGFFKKE
jgi:hypothetical protein